MPMRWLLIVLLISVGSLLIVAGAVARHIRRQRPLLPEEALGASIEDRRGDV